MSVAQIITELPNLTAAELLSVRRALLEVIEENADIAACDAAATEGALTLDRMEQEDAGR